MKKTLAIALTLCMLLTSVFAQGLAEAVVEANEDTSYLVPVKAELDPENPYAAYHYGLFHNQKCTYSTTLREGNTEFPVPEATVTYSTFIPTGFQVKSSLYIILIPDGMTAKDFSESETGMEWIRLANSDKDPFAVAFVEPQGGEKWNTAEAADGRDEAAAAYAVFSALRDKSSAENAFISVDKSGVRVVGYKEGADTAAIWAAAWPQLFANVTLIEPTKFDKNTIDKWLDSTIYPYAIDGKGGYDMGMKGRDVAMPLFIYSKDKTIIENYTTVWTSINHNCENNDTSRDRSLEIVRVMKDSKASTIYENAKQNNRFLGYPGGTVRGVFYEYDSINGFSPVWEDNTIDNYTRRWMTYVPESYDGSSAVPLVVALHGSSASITDLPEESRWSDVADEYGFIVVFVQGYPNGTPNPIPAWFSYAGAQVDIDYIKAVVGKVQDAYNIDCERMYLTGHSLGSMMTQVFASSQDRAFFAAYVPVGYTLGETYLLQLNGEKYMDAVNNTTTIPCWFMKGEFDINGNKIDGTKGGDTDALNFWAKTVNGLSEMSDAYDESLRTDLDVTLPKGKFLTHSFSIGNVEVVKYTRVMQSPHTYMAEESKLAWTWLKNWSRDSEGKSYYNGIEVTIKD